MRKTVVIVLAVILVLIVVGGLAFWYMTGQPFYTPGMVREQKNLRAPLTPPEQLGDADYWQVEPDIQLYHFAEGDGRNVLVVHGGPGVPFRQPLTGLEPLVDTYRFHYYDQRGSGQSTRPFDTFDSPNTYQNMTRLEQTLGLGAQIADIERIRQILGDEKLILVGHSWGGFLASLYAAEFPEHVEALVLISPATTLVMPMDEPDLFDGVRERLPVGKQAEYDIFMKDYLDFNKIFTLSEADLVAMGDQFSEYYVEAVDKPVPEPGELGGWMVWAMYVSMGQRHDYRPALKSVTAPSLVIYGSDDLQSEAATRQYTDSLPNAQLVTINDASHFAFEEQPALFAEAVTAFLMSLQDQDR
ncbi:MAG: alpha/beta hydrolase [Anaerolineae bacterium]|nr:alpha/beta hydrolase [Anaerolineae bacterium]